MHFFSKISTGLLLICSFTISSPNALTGKTYQPEKVFDTLFNTDKPGDMGNFEKDVEEMYEQALGILQETIISLDFLLKLNVEPNESVKDLRDKYLRIAQPFKLLLGNEDVWTGKGVLNPRVKEVRGKKHWEAKTAE